MKVELHRIIKKDIQKISNTHILESFYDFIEICIKSDSLLNIGNIKKIQGFSHYYRYRIRDYRVGIRYEHDTMYIERFLHRKDIYKLFP